MPGCGTVARHLVGHPVVAVDLRGHGLPPRCPTSSRMPPWPPPNDLASVCDDLGWSAPVVAGQSWGGNVVLQLAADRPLHGIALVDGGWLQLSDRFATIDDAWAVLAPPPFEGLTAEALRARLHKGTRVVGRGGRGHGGQPGDPRRRRGVARLTRERHRAIVDSMLAHRPQRAVRAGRVPGAAPRRGSGQPGGERGRGGDPARRARSRSPAAITTCTPNTRREVAALDRAAGVTGRLAIMGSGETAPTMVEVHRATLRAAGERPSVLLDTPYGFQENADDITAKAVAYFGRSVGRTVAPLVWRTRLDGAALDRALTAVRTAGSVFAGPGNPTYALRAWAAPVRRRARRGRDAGGMVTFASAAALTLGSTPCPVYEIYKSGVDPAGRRA